MNANIIMWTGGMLPVLGAFAFRLGAGFHAGRLRTRWIAMLVAGYLGLFALAAFFSGALAQGLQLLLGKGPYPHMAFAGGMIVWGLWLAGRRGHVLKGPGRAGPAPMRVLPLILPCPVSLGAVAFSVCAAAAVLRLPPLFAGLCLGVPFVLTSLTVPVVLRRREGTTSTAALGLAMIVIGLYFALSLAIPAKIEEAKAMYASFLVEHQTVDTQTTLGALGIVSIMMLIGYFAGKQRKEMES